MLHGFGGPVELLEDFGRMGLYFSFGGLLSNPAASRCQGAAAAVKTSRLLLESDCPDHPPRLSGEAQSQPAHLRFTLARLAEVRGQSEDSLAKACSANARKLFGLSKPA